VTRPRLLAAAVALCAAAVAGCGLGPGQNTGSAELTITRDYGARELGRSAVELRESDTVMRVLDRGAEIETRYGGRFVQSIDDLAGAAEDGRRSDWFFFVNGIESPIGAAEYDPADGERLWWDYRDWSTAMRAPAVVGSFPEPFEHGFEGRHWGAGVYCGGARSQCGLVNQRLSEQGIETGDAPGAEDDGSAGDEIRVLVGPWDTINADPVARLLAGGPQRSGVFATFSGVEPSIGLTLLDQRGRVAETLAAGAGLVAALRPGDGPPTWVVTGTDAAGVGAALDLLDERKLRNHYAVAAVSDQGSVGVPVP
jgi:Domain of unknown function (DUF4430)